MEVVTATSGERRGRRRWLSLPLPRVPRLPLPGLGARITRPRKASFASASAATIAISDCTVTGAGGALSVNAAAPAAAGAAATAKVAVKPASDVIAGALARAASQSTIHPLDTFKVRLQANGGKAAAATAASGVSKFGQLVPPPGAAGAAFELRQLGMTVRSLYKGVVGAASGAGIAIGAYFAVYGVASNALSTHTDLTPGGIAFLSGAIAAAGSSVVKVPLAVCIRSVQAGVYPNVFAAARAITTAAGPRGLFTGYWPTLLEDVPDMAFKFATYETMRNAHSKLNGGRTASPAEDFSMGAVAGAVAAAATTPLDVIKTRMMCAAASRPTMSAAARAVLAQSGPSGFFAGVGTRALSNGINSAVFFCFFETIRSSFKERSAAAAAAAAAVPAALPLPVSAGGEEEEALLRGHGSVPGALLASATPLQLEGSKLVITVQALKRMDNATNLVSEDA